MSTQAKTILQEVFILATGRAANAGELSWLQSLTGPRGDDYASLIQQVDSYMISLMPSYGVTGLIKMIAKNGLGIVLTDEQANAQIKDFLAHGIDTWGKVFEFCVKLGTSDGMVLNNRATASQTFVDNLDGNAKGGFFTGVGVSSAVNSLLQNIGASANSLSNGQAGFNTLASKLTAVGITGAVVDGYVRDATVFVDANGDGIQNNGEFSTVTDASGNFVLPNGTAGGKIVAFGGTDLLTGKAFQGVLTAPAGSTQVTPVTTLIQALLTGGHAATLEAATATVQKVLALPTGVNLLTYDPLAVLASSTASTADKAVALGVQASAQQLANIITHGTAAINAASGRTTTTLQGAADAVTSALASAVAGAAVSTAGTLSLSSTTALTGIMQTAATSAGATALAGQAGQLAQVTAASNTAAAGATTITELAKAAVVAQGSATDALVAGAGSGSLSNVVSGFTGSALTTAVNNATAGEIAPGVSVPTGTTPLSSGGLTSPGPALTYSLSTFAEAAANDGSITAKLVLTLNGGTFTGANGLLLAGAVVANVPAGLTAVVTKLSATTAELSFTGKATNHFNSHDISNLSLTLGNAAFTGGNAGGFTGASKSNLALDFADPVLTYSGSTLAEAVANDGSITAKLVLTLNGGTFTGTNGLSLAGAVVTNVPAGLTAVVTKISATTAQLGFTGNATAHANAQDISNLAVTLGNDAFTGGSAAAVTGAVKSGFSINFADTPVLSYSAGKLKESTPANDGSITTKLTLTLSGDTFTGTNGQPLTGASVTHVPAGLTAVVTKTSAATAELSFTGRATAHAHAQDISNLTVTLGDNAFTSGYAGAVNGATKSDLVIDFADPDGGNISDGYIRDATVFADANRDGVWLDVNSDGVWQEGDEAMTRTDAQGNFKLASGGHGIVSFGGIDISTGLAHTGVLKAPAGSTVINPLTTLVAAIAASGGTVAEAQAQVVAKLGLATGTDLSNYDPLVQATRTGATTQEVANAVAVQKAAAKVANIMVQTASTILGQAAGTNAASNATEAAKAIAGLITASSTTINLTSTTLLEAVLITAAGNAAGATDVQKNAINAAATAVASVMSASNTAVRDATGSNTIDTLTNMAKVQVVAQGDAATALRGDLGVAVTQYTATNLTTKVAAASAGTVYVNTAPTIDRVLLQTQAQRVTAGQSAALNDFTVTDADGDNLTVTLTAANGTIGGLTDTDAGAAGIQLAGTATSINTALATATFTAAAAGSASITISVSDGKVNSPSVSGTYHLIANGLPTGAPTISGTVAENQVLTAVTSGISDGNGVGTFRYQWQRDGSVISGATASTYTLGDVDVAKNISVQVSYTDGNGTIEQLTSVQTASVLNVNDAPAGLPTISGTVRENQTLTAGTSGLSDADGLGALSYQWLREGSAIAGATASTYSLGDADVGKKISVKVSYSDAYDTNETLTSAESAIVANINDLPAGVPAITGTVARNQTLTAVTSGIRDDDGLGTFGYQWLRDGTAISGATASTYILGGADVARNISVKVNYIDGHGTAETLTSAQTAAVANGSETRLVGAGQDHATIQSAINAAFAGDTILVAAGIYTENVTLNKTGVTLKTTAAAEIVGVVRLVANNITIEGFKLDGTGQTANIRGLQIVSGDGITVANMEVSHFTTGASLDFAIVSADQAAAGVTGSPRNVQFAGNSFTGNTSAIGRTENVPGLYVAGNTFTGNEEDIGLGLSATVVGSNGSVITIQTLLASNTFDSAVIRDYRGSGGLVTYASGEFTGTSGADKIVGFASNDTFTGGAGADTIDGGAGNDVAVFSGDRSAYVISAATLADRTGNLTAKTLTVVGPDGSDTITGIETLDFASGTDVRLTGAISVFRGLVFKNSYGTIEAANAAAVAGDTIISTTGVMVTLPESRATLDATAIDSAGGDLYAGNGNSVTGFQIARVPELGLELALKAKIRSGSDGSGSGNVYQVPSGLISTNRAAWNIDFSIAADTDNNDTSSMLSAYNFKFLIDVDPSAATRFVEINPLADGNDNNVSGSVINPNSVGKDVAQNSFNLGFFPTGNFTNPADYYAAGRFDVKLQALDKTSGAVVLESAIVVIAKNPITGTAGNDTLTGTAADDLITGAAGNDVITGGDGSDALSGGTGADTFAYTSASQSLTAVNTASDLLASLDHITDFTPGTDKISLAKVVEAGMRTVGTHFVNLSGSQASIGAAADLKAAMTLAAAALHAGGAKGVGSFQFGGNTYVLAQDADAALSAEDIAIQLNNLLTLTAADFLTLNTSQASRAMLDATAIDAAGNDMYSGNGNTVAGFQIARADDIGLELALKAKTRGGADGTGTGNEYQVPGGTTGAASSLRAAWSIDFSIAADTDNNNAGSVLSSYDFKFLIDTDRSAATHFVEVNALTYATDHNFYNGNSIVNPASLGKDVVQNSFNFAFAGFQALFNNPATSEVETYNYGAAEFDVKLLAVDKISGKVVLEDAIVVKVGSSFSATVSNTAVSFGGTAGGPITMSLSGNAATFSRGGETAVVNSFTGKSISLASGQDLTLTAAQVNAQRVNIANGGKLIVDVAFTAPAGGTGLLPVTDVSNVFANGQNGPAAVWNAVEVVGDVATKYKLFWVSGDRQYYTSTPGGTVTVNKANVELANLYATYLRGGGISIDDIVQTKVSSLPNASSRQQSLNDNVLDNVRDSVIASRFSSQSVADPRNADAKFFGTRPSYDGYNPTVPVALARLQEVTAWDIANDIRQYSEINHTLMAGQLLTFKNADNNPATGMSLASTTHYASVQTAIDAIPGGGTLVAGSGTHAEAVNVFTAGRSGALELLGAHAGVVATATSRGSNETIVDAGSGSYAIRAQGALSGTVTIDGFTVKTGTDGGIGQFMTASAGTFHVLNNIVSASVASYTAHGNSIQISGAGSTVIGNKVEIVDYTTSIADWSTSAITVVKDASGALIQNNSVTRAGSIDVGNSVVGIAVDGHYGSNSAGLNGIVVSGNTVSGVTAGISIVDEVGATISGNTLANNIYGVSFGSTWSGWVDEFNVSVSANTFLGNTKAIAFNDFDGGGLVIITGNTFNQKTGAIWFNSEAAAHYTGAVVIIDVGQFSTGTGVLADKVVFSGSAGDHVSNVIDDQIGTISVDRAGTGTATANLSSSGVFAGLTIRLTGTNDYAIAELYGFLGAVAP